jgi:hypothetical protein
MLKGKHISLLIVLLVPVFALCMTTGAVAADCSGSAAFTCSVSSGGWVVKIAPGVSQLHAGEFPVFCNGTDTSPECVDKRGNPIKGYRFAYDVYAPWGGNLVQADLLASICSGNPITKTYPTDQSVKFLATDPNSGYAGGTSDFVIAWSALKLDPSNHVDIAVYTTKAGAGGQGMQLQTGTGYENINKIFGPVCCVSYAGALSSITVGDTTTTYDTCTAQLTSVSRTSDSSSLTPVTGLYLCMSSTGVLDPSQCGPIKRMGPASGAYIDVSDFQGYPGDPYTGTRYYGYGNKFYKQSISGTFPGGCTGNPLLGEDSITFDNAFVAKYNSCGDVTSVTYSDGTSASQSKAWIFEADSHGKMTNIGGLVVNSGPRNGAIIDDYITLLSGGYAWPK